MERVIFKNLEYESVSGWYKKSISNIKHGTDKCLWLVLLLEK